MKKLVLLCTHLAVGAFGFGLGVYALPILIEPDSPSSSSVEAISQQAIYTGEFALYSLNSVSKTAGADQTDKTVTFCIGERAPSLSLKVR